VAVSLTIPLAFLIGAGAIPAGLGIMADTVSFAFGFALVGVFILMGFLLSLTLQLPAENECPTTFFQEQR
jgi:hypothetical protein